MKKQSDFEIFKKEFTKWQNRFGLSGWKIFFYHVELKDCYANITPDVENMVATVRLNSKVVKGDKYRDVKKSAKHEALHLLIMKLEACGRWRYVNEDEITESSEELVHKLEGLID